MADFDIAAYWDRRYAAGRTSGPGSEGALAKAKARHVSDLIHRERIWSVVDWGVGDGEVMARILRDIHENVYYAGVDVSPVAVQHLKRRYVTTWQVDAFHLDKVMPSDFEADLALSLDVMFHLVDDDAYLHHLDCVFRSATRFALVHATDHDGGRTARHVRWRHWTGDVITRYGSAWRPAVAWPADPKILGWYLWERVTP